MKASLIRLLSFIYPMAKRGLHRFHGGIFPKTYKSLSLKHPIVSSPIPERLILPVKQLTGQKIDWHVAVGDTVQKNQCLISAAKENKKGMIVPIHAPTSGVIEAIEIAPLPHPSGLNVRSIIIKPDFKDRALKNVLNVNGARPETPQQFKDILLNAGIVGLGGAGFPTFAKLPNQTGEVKTLILNGAECEPFITCDDVLMQTQAEEILKGALMIAQTLDIPNIVCGIEANKTAAIQAMQTAADTLIQSHATQRTNLSIQTLPTVYPMGGEKQLILELTGIEIPAKTHAIDSGLLVFNVATSVAIFKAIHLGEPLTQRFVTVAGLGLTHSYNALVRIGTPFITLAQAGQPKQPIQYPLIMGGPMMGFQVADNQVPVIKTTNCILVQPPEATQATVMPCIRCGECMDACPVNLLPQQMYWHSQAHEFDKVEKLNIFDCIECGCCSYVCPSHIPLVQFYRHAKSEIKQLHAEQQAAELAKQRYEFRLARIEREKREREARIKAKKAAVKKQATDAKGHDATTPAKAAAMKAAAARAAAKRTQNQSNQSTPTSPPLSARQKAIDAAKKQAAAKVGSKIAPNKDPRTSAKQAAKKAAAMAAAKRRAQNNNESKLTTTPNTETDSKPPLPESSESSKLALNEKRQKAMEAAKKRAAERKARQAQQESP